DAGRVGDDAVLDRHVEIGAHQHALAADLEIVERAKFRHRTFSPVAGRSDVGRRVVRFEADQDNATMILPSGGGRRQSEIERPRGRAGIGGAGGGCRKRGRPGGAPPGGGAAGGEGGPIRPAVVAPRKKPRPPRHGRLLAVAPLLVAPLAGLGYYVWRQAHPP